MDATGGESERFGRLLVIVTLSFIISAFSARWASTAVALLNGVLVVTAFRSTGLRGALPRRPLLFGLTLIAAVAVVVRAVADEQSTSQAVASFLQAGVLCFVIIALLRAILRHQVVTVQTIIGAIAAYALIGLTFSWIFLGIDTLDDSQLSLDPSMPETYPEFSFITLTTVGYGNQVPTATFSARIAVILAIIGQIFLATFVARLVSLYGRDRPATAPDPKR
ncbi:MAG: potassium channel family protein [Actinomycetota bacterium]